MLFTAFYHSHKLIVLLFVAIYLIKTLLLLVGSAGALDKFTKLIKIPEMIISLLLLATGGYLVMGIANLNALFVVKLVFVLSAIPLAVIGFRKKKKLLAFISLLLLVGAYGLAEVYKAQMGKRQAFSEEVITNPQAQNYVQSLHGKALYNAQCKICHGEDGTAGLSGAKNLQSSVYPDKDIRYIIESGKNTMPKMEGIFTDQELSAMVVYVKGLRKKQATE